MAAGRKKFTPEEVAALFKGSISSSEDEFKAEETFSEFIYCQLEEDVVYWLVNTFTDNSLQGCLISVILSYLDRGHAEHSNDAHFNSIHAFPRKKKNREFHLLWLGHHF